MTMRRTSKAPFFQPLVTEMADRKLRVHPSLSQAGDKPHGITGTGRPQQALDLPSQFASPHSSLKWRFQP